ncbi:4Fe-4S binding protein [Trichlorobacter ammonificans]|uniref:Electron transport complex protein RnfB n=1 Tax=Trichlorobacter ammonificans TaxID=2916410 RepID=A0ABM9D7B8_9BACT|nr:4Fe-4S dicluster domain-containing protein [Trichlorobacter ammonificans]CAH2031114.1 Electron transport complex protein RnfB [Trichlorobacter ammonificans]
MTHSPTAGEPVVDRRRCSGCGRCVAACPLRILSLEPEGYRKRLVMAAFPCCTRCGACAGVCPLQALRMAEPR